MYDRMGGGDQVPSWIDWTNWWAFVDHWQTMAGALIALPFAFLAILAPWLIAQQQAKRRFAAARATFPLYLSQVSGYARTAGRRLKDCRTSHGVSAAALAAFEAPRLPDGLADRLEKVIEATSNKNAVARIANMVREIQVLEARMAGLADDAPQGDYVDSMLLDAAIIHAQVDSLFDFARGATNRVAKRITWRSIGTATNIMRINPVQHADFHAMIGRWAARDVDPERIGVRATLRSNARGLASRAGRSMRALTRAFRSFWRHLRG